MRYTTPLIRPGQSIGLLGGSFDPPHAGHVHITRQALRQFGLDRVWWLVSPGNPLKARGPAPSPQLTATLTRSTAHCLHHPVATTVPLQKGEAGCLTGPLAHNHDLEFRCRIV